MAALFQAGPVGSDIKPVTYLFAAPDGSELPAASASDSDALSLEIRLAGKRMESAYAAGDRALAQVWMQCMYGLIQVRNAAFAASDIKAGGVA